MTRRGMWISGAVVVMGLGLSTAADAQEKAAKGGGAQSARVKRGEYLVNVGGCHDCHTPMKMGPQGPAPDMSRALTGHPEGMVMPPPPAPVGPWIVAGAGTLTAWAGPWGVSYARNLTPDKETGLGRWTEQNFVETMRTGRRMGRGRPLLPPMPWQSLNAMTDEDIKSVFAYLQSRPPVKNRIPEPSPPPQPQQQGQPVKPQGEPAAGPRAK